MRKLILKVAQLLKQAWSLTQVYLFLKAIIFSTRGLQRTFNGMKRQKTKEGKISISFEFPENSAKSTLKKPKNRKLTLTPFKPIS